MAELLRQLLVAATLLTPFGEAASSWSVRGAKVSVDATDPPNTNATVLLPLAAGRDVRENDAISQPTPREHLKQDGS